MKNNCLERCNELDINLYCLWQYLILLEGIQLPKKYEKIISDLIIKIEKDTFRDCSDYDIVDTKFYYSDTLEKIPKKVH